jgi:polyhydroxyalkanoate synthesis regulator phasin
MENQIDTSNTDESARDADQDASGFSERIRERAKLVRAQIDAAEARAKQRWQEMPAKVKGALQQAVVKVRDGLDLPSRTEINSLAQRIDELDRKIADYETQSGSKKRKNSEPVAERS